jgi:uncharacterized DUF497 family protein
MAIVWDIEKFQANIAKHGIRFPDAASALEDPKAITVADHESDPEERLVTLGLDPPDASW